MVNKVILIGNVGKIGEARYLPDGKPVIGFSLATSRKVNGEQVTDWHSITAFGKTAEIVQQYVTVGKKLYIEGSIRYEKYEKEGVEKSITKIICNDLQMLSAKSEGHTEAPMPEPRQANQYMQQTRQQQYQPNDLDDDDIPF